MAACSSKRSAGWINCAGECIHDAGERKRGLICVQRGHDPNLCAPIPTRHTEIAGFAGFAVYGFFMPARRKYFATRSLVRSPR